MGFLDKLRGQSVAAPVQPHGVLSAPIDISVPRDAVFTYVETIDYEAASDDAPMSAYNMVEARSHGRFMRWRDDRDRILYDDELAGSGNRLPTKDVAFHRPSGVVAAAGIARSELFANPSEHTWVEAL
jgi:hypothetical protein